MLRYALEAISEDEDAAAAAGVNVTVEKLKITVLSALMTAFAGAIYCQYQMFISPDTVSGIAVSLQMVFAAVVGGIYVALGPTVGAVITILLAEILRISFGTKAVGWDNLVYGVAAGAVHHLPAQGHPGQPARPRRASGGRRLQRRNRQRCRSSAHRQRRQARRRDPGRQGGARQQRPAETRTSWPRLFAASSSRAATFSVSPT